jgi:hypothetical protein
VGHGVEMAKEHGLKLPAGELALRNSTKAKVRGDREGKTSDSTSIYGIVRQEAGWDFETEIVKGKCELSNSV